MMKTVLAGVRDRESAMSPASSSGSVAKRDHLDTSQPPL